jgi:hypothetical protein
MRDVIQVGEGVIGFILGFSRPQAPALMAHRRRAHALLPQVKQVNV